MTQRWSVLFAVVLLAGCGGDDANDSAGPGTQQQLDEAVAKVEELFEVLESSYPEDDETPDSVVDAFADAMVDEGIVEDVRRLEEWQLGDRLPCGEGDDPTLGVIATGGERSFFIGVASSAFVAGFAEGSEGDLGVVVGRCDEGRTGTLRVVELPENDTPLRVAIESFADADSPTGRAIERLHASYERNEPPDVRERQGEWQIGQPIQCPDSDDEPVAIGSQRGGDYFAGYGTSDVVAVFVQHASIDIGSWAAPCDDEGTADQLRRIARPLDEALEEPDDSVRE